METIKIKCPCCGGVLMVKKVSGIENKKIKCPVCNIESHYKAYKLILEKHFEEHTQYHGGEEHTSYAEKMSVTSNLNLIIGRVKLTSSPYSSYQLKFGRNVIGRKATASTSDFQICTNDEKRMSREHLVIEVKKVPGKGFVHYVSLYKEKVNETFVKDEKLVFGETLILTHGDIIKLPDANLLFELPDDEGTEI